MRLCKAQSNIQGVEDWFQIAPPKKGILQWKDGRSAKELAKAWFGRRDLPHPPVEFLRLLSPLANADQLEEAEGWPEHKVPIDDLPGEEPNIDLAIVIEGTKGRTAICIEAKADESFGRYLSDIHDEAAKKIGQGKKTGVMERLLRLENELFPDATAGHPGRGELRYQLLTGTAATIALAKSHQALVAVFVVHEFLFAGHVDEKKVAQNTVDLSCFVTRLTGGTVTSVPAGVLVGPISSPLQRSSWRGVSLYIGKVSTTGTLAVS